MRSFSIRPCTGGTTGAKVLDGFHGLVQASILLGMMCAVTSGAQTPGPVSAPTAAMKLDATPEVKLWSAADLDAQAKALMAEAAASKGSAGSTLMRLPTQYTMLTTRTRSGGAEQHTGWCDYLVILAGEGTELTGGTIVDRQQGEGGEIKGSRLEGAQKHALHAGDVLFIPAGTPHQAIEAPGQSLTVFVVKTAAASAHS